MSEQNQSKKQSTLKTARRKRVNRFKSLIVGIAILLLFFSVVLNFILALRVMKLEEKVEQLYSQECLLSDDLYV